MLTESQKTELIEKYTMGSLTEEEQLLFADLEANNEDFALEISFHKDFMDSIEVHGDNQLKAHFQNLEQSIQSTNNATQEQTPGLLTDLKHQINYSIDQLVAMFQPVSSYQMIMSYTNRSKGLEVVRPENETDCKHAALSFELKTYSDSPINIQIENNGQEVILGQTIDAKESFFMVDLPSDLIPGIYYWKLSNKEDMLMGSFFIQKELLKKIQS